MKDKTIFILGAGQVGEACAIRALKEQPKRIIMHALTEEEAKQVTSNIEGKACAAGVEISPSWGNALVTERLMHVPSRELHAVAENRKELLDYYYSYLSDDVVRSSALYSIIKKWKPDYIFDGINTATVVGYQDDPYSLPRRILSQDDQDFKEATSNLLVSNTVPSLIRFTQALKWCLSEFKVTCYVKISTTGLGGMGDNLFYTHGDLNEPGMSSGILGKVAAAGIIHQLLWSLSHTPGYNIKVVVPAALVGWQKVDYGPFRSHGKSIALVDSTDRIKLQEGLAFPAGHCSKVAEEFNMPYVDSGENCAYSLGEMTAITAQGQMGSVTREEVAQAVIECASGSTRHDLLTAMDMVSLGPSHAAAMQRRTILDRLARLEDTHDVRSIATNNLGPTVSKHLFELFLLMEVADYSIERCVRTDSSDLVSLIDQYVTNTSSARRQIISLGLPILFDNGEVIVGEYYYVPNPTDNQLVSTEHINIWAESGWVDLRQKQIEYWQGVLSRILEETEKLEESAEASLDRNWQKIRSGDIGEILGFAYSMQGGARRTSYV